MAETLHILGTGGHARDIAEIAAALGYRPVLVTHLPEVAADWQGDDPVILEKDALGLERAAFAIGIGDNAARSKIAARLRDRLRFPSLIHPDTSLGRGLRERIEATAGTVLFPGVRLTANVTIGDFCTVNCNATLSHDVELGDFANISPGASIAGNVRIAEGAWIGVGAAINHGTDSRKLEVGAWTTVGSGAVVTGDCAPNSVYVGVPARKIR